MDKIEEIKMRAKAIIGANIGTTFDRTQSVEVEKYVVLIKQIVRKRLKYKCLTSLNMVTKQWRFFNKRGIKIVNEI